jgi:hypothetical protein
VSVEQESGHTVRYDWALFVGGPMHGATRQMEIDEYGQPRAYLEATETVHDPFTAFPGPESALMMPDTRPVMYRHRVVDGKHIYEVQR